MVMLVINGWGISCEIALRWLSQDLTDDKSISVQVMAWYLEATNHYHYPMLIQIYVAAWHH